MNKKNREVGEVAQQASVLYSHEDLGASPQGPCKTLDMSIGACDPGNAGWTEPDPGSSLPSKLGLNNKILVQG